MSVFELFISAIFVNNIVLAQYLGNCPYLGCSRATRGSPSAWAAR